jgi:phenylpyruvate tautomerase PptA (4-oxalocrotonate tautomerase family)
MPLTVVAPEGVLVETAQRELLPRLTDALLDANGATGNSFVKAMIGGTLTVLPPELIFAEGTNRPVVTVELKAPNIALGTIEARAAFITAATDIVQSLAVPGHAREDIWVFVLNALDGAWGIGGKAYTNEALVAAITAAG